MKVTAEELKNPAICPVMCSNPFCAKATGCVCSKFGDPEVMKKKPFVPKVGLDLRMGFPMIRCTSAGTENKLDAINNAGEVME